MAQGPQQPTKGALVRVAAAWQALRGTQSKAIDPRKTNAMSVALSGLMHPANRPQPDQGALTETETHNPVIWRCMQAKAEDCASVPLTLMGGTPADPEQEIREHQVLELFNNPAPTITASHFWQDVYCDLDGAGDFFAYAYTDRKLRPVSFERLLPHHVTPIPDESGRRIISAYEWETPNATGVLGRTGGYGFARIPAEDMIHVKTRNPDTWMRGLGTLARLRMLIHLDRVMQDWNWNRYSEGIPTQYLVFFNGQFAPGERDMVTSRLRHKFTGPSGDNFMLIEGNGDGQHQFDVHPFPRPTEDELAFLDSEQRNMYRICMAFGVPPHKVMDFSQATRVANADAMERLYWEDTVKAMHTVVLDWLNGIFLPRYYAGERMFFQYDYSRVRALQQSAVEVANVHALYVDRGVLSRNEVREQLGLPVVPDPMMSAYLQNGRPLGEPLLPPGFGPPGGEGEPEDDSEDDAEDAEDGEEGAEDSEESEDDKRAKVVPIRAKMVPADLISLELEQQIFERLVRRKIEAMVRRAGEQMLELSGAAGTFDHTSPEVLRFIERQIVELVQDKVANTDAMVRSVVAEALADGASIAEMRTRMQDAFTVAREPWQLDRISRTEVHTAQEGGSWMAARQNGAERKSWVTAKDSKVRGLEMDDQADHDGIEQAGPVDIDSPFEDPRSHALMQFPGDRMGTNVSGFDTINCRCTWTVDWGHLERSMGKGKAELWEAKYRQRLIWERDMARTVKQYLVGLERRVLDAFDRRAQEPIVGGQRASH